MGSPTPPLPLPGDWPRESYLRVCHGRPFDFTRSRTAWYARGHGMASTVIVWDDTGEVEILGSRAPGTVVTHLLALHAAGNREETEG